MTMLNDHKIFQGTQIQKQAQVTSSIDFRDSLWSSESTITFGVLAAVILPERSVKYFTVKDKLPQSG